MGTNKSPQLLSTKCNSHSTMLSLALLSMFLMLGASGTVKCANGCGKTGTCEDHKNFSKEQWNLWIWFGPSGGKYPKCEGCLQIDKQKNKYIQDAIKNQPWFCVPCNSNRKKMYYHIDEA